MCSQDVLLTRSEVEFLKLLEFLFSPTNICYESMWLVVTTISREEGLFVLVHETFG